MMEGERGAERKRQRHGAAGNGRGDDRTGEANGSGGGYKRQRRGGRGTQAKDLRLQGDGAADGYAQIGSDGIGEGEVAPVFHEAFADRVAGDVSDLRAKVLIAAEDVGRTNPFATLLRGDVGRARIRSVV